MQLKELLSSGLYRQNLDFWYRAWNMVKVPYTQMLDLPYLKAIPENLKAHGAKKVLDLGCGSGWLSVYLARMGFSVTGIDVAPHAIVLARSWAAQEELSIVFNVADIADIDYEKATFDAVVANSIFEHFTLNLACAVVAKLRSLLIDGGLLIACFDRVGTGPGECYKLDDGTQVYTDKSRRGMMLRYFNDQEILTLFKDWQIEIFQTLENGSRFLVVVAT